MESATDTVEALSPTMPPPCEPAVLPQIVVSSIDSVPVLEYEPPPLPTAAFSEISLLSTVAALLWYLDPASREEKLDILRRYLFTEI